MEHEAEGEMEGDMENDTGTGRYGVCMYNTYIYIYRYVCLCALGLLLGLMEEISNQLGS